MWICLNDARKSLHMNLLNLRIIDWSCARRQTKFERICRSKTTEKTVNGANLQSIQTLHKHIEQFFAFHFACTCFVAENRFRKFLSTLWIDDRIRNTQQNFVSNVTRGSSRECRCENGFDARRVAFDQSTVCNTQKICRKFMRLAAACIREHSRDLQ